MPFGRFTKVPLYPPTSIDWSTDEVSPIRDVVMVEVDLDQRIVTLPGFGEFDLDSFVRVVETVKMLLDARRTGIVKLPPAYGPETSRVLRWFHRYLHQVVDKNAELERRGLL